MLDVAELRKKNIEDLKKELEKTKKDMQKTVSDILQKKEKNVKKAGLMKKDIARLQTVLNEKLSEDKK
jgi:ribosomal protein L29